MKVVLFSAVLLASVFSSISSNAVVVGVECSTWSDALDTNGQATHASANIYFDNPENTYLEAVYPSPRSTAGDSADLKLATVSISLNQQTSASPVKAILHVTTPQGETIELPMNAAYAKESNFKIPGGTLTCTGTEVVGAEGEAGDHWTP